jgi:2'-5' RNA ligase
MRSFIAINLPATVKSEIGEIVTQLRPAGPPARWVPADNVHLTLKFLDEIEADQVGPLVEAIERASIGVPPFDLALGGFGVFPNPRRARVFWIGIESGAEALRGLAQAIDDRVRKLGFPREKRAFSAHLTLARLRRPAPAETLVTAAERLGYHSDPARITRIDLMRSVLSPSGAQYTVLESVPLRDT